jgi:hypothetical protein
MVAESSALGLVRGARGKNNDAVIVEFEKTADEKKGKNHHRIESESVRENQARPEKLYVVAV